MPFVPVDAEEYTNQSVKNYVMMEKFNGVRVYLFVHFPNLLNGYFDGQLLRSSKNKQVLSLANHLVTQLPAIPFEAELLGSYSTWSGKLKAPLILKVFDSAEPKKFHLGYAERLKYLRQRIIAPLYALL